MIPLHFQPSVETVQGYAEDAVRLTLEQYRMDLSKYDLASLERVDFVLNEWRHAGADINQIGKSMYAFGAFAGEVLRNLEPGRWFKPTTEENPDDFLEYPFLAVRLLDGREWKPINLGFAMFRSKELVNLRGALEELLSRTS